MFQNSGPLEAAPRRNQYLKTGKNNKKKHCNSKGGAFFQNFHLLEAAPLLNLYLRTTNQIKHILGKVSFFKTLACRRQHPC